MTRTTHRLLLAAALAVGTAACGTAPEPRMDLAWPPPPEEPRITYERSIYGSESLPRSFSTRVRDFVFGEDPNQSLSKPYGVACPEGSRLYVVDTARKGIVALDLASGRVRFFNSLGPHGELAEPIALVVGPDGLLYVTDSKLGKVVVFDEKGRFLRFIGADGDLETPVGIAFGPQGTRLYVVDTTRHAVRVFDRDGNAVGGFGTRGDRQGEFHYPLGVAVGPDDVVYVVDSLHFAVQAFDPEGGFLFSIGATPDGPGPLARPRAIALDSDGNLYVTDALRNRVQMFDAQGRRLLDFGSYGLGDGEFRLPAGICVTPDDRIYVVDSINLRVQEFRYLSASGKETGS